MQIDNKTAENITHISTGIARAAVFLGQEGIIPKIDKSPSELVLCFDLAIRQFLLALPEDMRGI